MSAFAGQSNRLPPNYGGVTSMTKLRDRPAADALTVSRRSFLIGMVGTAVAFGFTAREVLAIATSAPVTSRFDPTIWYSIDRDGIVTVNIIRAEMGQHVGTALARILADELEADWRKVRIDAVDT